MKQLMIAAACGALLAGSAALAQETTPAPLSPPAAAPATECQPGQTATATGAPCPDTGQSPTVIQPGPDAAQGPTFTQPDTTPGALATTAPEEPFRDMQHADEFLTSKIIGAAVMNEAGEHIGDVKDIVFIDTGDLDAVIIGVGGFLGIGEKSVAISYSLLTPSKNEDGDLVLMASLDKDRLNAAPAFKTLEDQDAERPLDSPVAPAPGQ